MRLRRRHFLLPAAGAARVADVARRRARPMLTNRVRPVYIDRRLIPPGQFSRHQRTTVGPTASPQRQCGQPFLRQPKLCRVARQQGVATELVVRASADGLRTSSGCDQQLRQRDALQNCRAISIRDIEPVASRHAHCRCHGGDLVRVRSRLVPEFKSPNAGVSGQAQHGVGRHRKLDPRGRRVVQD